MQNSDPATLLATATPTPPPPTLPVPTAGSTTPPKPPPPTIRSAPPPPDLPPRHEGEDGTSIPKPPPEFKGIALVPRTERTAPKGKDSQLTFEKKYGVVFTLTRLDADHCNLKSGTIFKNRATGKRRRERIFLADGAGKIIAKIPEGASITKFASAQKHQKQISGAFYLCVIIERELFGFLWWRTVDGRKIKFTKPGELLAAIRNPIV